MLLKLIETYKTLVNELKFIYDERESRSIALLLLEPLGFSNLAVSLEPHTLITHKQQEELDEMLVQVKSGKPVQYVLGRVDFYGLSFMVNSHVLIPRPETEELVDMIIKAHSQSMPVIMDIGTGSGCIAVSLAKFIPQSRISAIDISEDALKVARKNALENGVKIEFLADDIINPSNSFKRASFDIIVSNPPYVLEEDIKEMKNNVLHFEPHKALFANSVDPLLFYRKIFDFSHKHLKPAGYVYCEINEKLGKEMKALALSYGFTKVEVIKDIREKDRFIRCTGIKANFELGV